MAEYVDSAVETVLSSSRLKLAHPGNAKLTQVYPTPSEVTSVLAQAINHRGQFRVSANSKGLGARSDFILSSSALISEIAIIGQITTAANLGVDEGIKPNAIGWGFDLIESVEITYSNSLMQNMFIRGETLKDYSLLCCVSPRERNDMLNAAGNAAYVNTAGGATNTHSVCIPISFLNHTPSSLRNSWPVDGSVLAGPIQISINWREAAYAFVKTNAAAVATPFPITWDKLDLVAKTTQLQDASFSVKKAMMLDPQLVYSLPARYITSVDYSREIPAAAGGGQTTINLASAPSGMLEGLIVSIRPKSANSQWVTPAAADAGTNNIRGGSCTLNRIVLEFGGQNIFRAESYEEYQHYMRGCFGDSMEWPGITFRASADWDLDGGNTDHTIHPVYFIPLVNDGCSVFRGHTNENLPSYGGAQLQLTLRVDPRQRIGSYSVDSGGSKLDTIQCTIDQPGISYQIWIGYVVSGLLEISQGTVDLQL